MTSQEWQEWLKALTPVGIILASAIVSAIRFFPDFRFQNSQSDKLQLEMMKLELDILGRDEVVREFIENAMKERMAELVFRRDVQPAELGSLMDYYRSGYATAYEIYWAWPHRVQYSRPLSFKLPWLELVGLIGSLYMVGFFIGVGVFSLLDADTMWSRAKTTLLMREVFGATFVALGLQLAVRYFGVFVAWRLYRRGKARATSQA